MKANNILISGSSGFIGRHAVPYLSKTYEVTSLSLRNEIVSEKPLLNVDCIICLSGLAHQSSTTDESAYFVINKDLPVLLAKTAKATGVKHFIYISSIKVFGDSQHITYDENSVCMPTDPYGKSKLEAEKELIKLASSEFIISIVRPAVVYGEGVKGNIKKLIGSIKKLPVLPFGNITSRRSIVYIDNLLAMIARIIEMRSSGIFIASDQPQTVTEIIAEINHNLKKPKKLVPFPDTLRPLVKYLLPAIYNRLFEELMVNNRLTRERLDFTPLVSFKEGIAFTVRTETQGYAD